jgi:hypothetical protein
MGIDRARKKATAPLFCPSLLSPLFRGAPCVLLLLLTVYIDEKGRKKMDRKDATTDHKLLFL